MIYLYENVTPNRGQNTHYVFSNLSNYVAAIAAASTNTTSFAEDSYRINSGVCMVYYNANNKPAVRLHNITYLRHVYTDMGNNTVTTFYHVTRAEMESGYLRLYLTRDDWATNYIAAKKSNLYVERCNKKLSLAGLYPDTDLLSSTQTVTDFPSNHTFAGNVVFTPSTDSYLIVYSVVTTTDGSLFSSDKSSSVQLYANKLSNMCDAMFTNDNLSFSTICTVVGTIKGQYTNDATVLKAYIIPFDMVEKYTLTTTERTNAALEFAGTVTTPGGPSNHVFPAYLPRQGIKTYSTTYNASIAQIDYVGTRFRLKKMPRVNSTGKVAVKYHFITKHESIEVLMQIGSEFIDITDQFTLTLGSTNAGVTASDDTRRAIQTMGTLVTSALGVAMAGTGNPAGLLMSVGGMATGITNSLYQQTSSGGISQCGDASTVCYEYDNGDKWLFPFKKLSFTTSESLSVKTTRNGLIYNQYYTSIPAGTDPLVHISTLQDEGTANPDGYYIRGQMRVTGVQADAAQFMENELAGGIYVKAV